MITKLTLSNFRSLGRNVVLDPGVFNVLVGPNGSGKSNVLRSLSFVRDALRLGLPGAMTHANGIDAVRRHSKGHPHNVRIELELSLEGHPARYAFELTGESVDEYRVKSEEAVIQSDAGTTGFTVQDGVFTGPESLRPNVGRQSLALTSLGGDIQLKPLWDALVQTMVYSISPSELRKPQKFSSEPSMLAEGENWVSILHAQEQTAWRQDLVAALQKLTGDIDGVKVTKAASFLIAEFRHRNEGNTRKWFPAERESDGTLRVAGILTALLQEPSLPVLGIEEPEQTVHPGALLLLYDYLREASTRSQVFVTTHSPILLNHLNLEDCRMFVVGRGEDGTAVSPLTMSQIASIDRDLLSLGELMMAGDLRLDLGWGSQE